MARFKGPRTRRLKARANREGATAVEFALIALPFFALLLAIFEIGIVVVEDVVFSTAVSDTARTVRTGEAASVNMTGLQFKQAVCSRMSAFGVDCMARMKLDVRVLPTFTSPAPDPFAAGGFQDSQLGFSTGAPSQIVLVRAWYQHTIFTPFLESGTTSTGKNIAWLTATEAFRNEPP